MSREGTKPSQHQSKLQSCCIATKRRDSSSLRVAHSLHGNPKKCISGLILRRGLESQVAPMRVDSFIIEGLDLSTGQEDHFTSALPRIRYSKKWNT